MSNIIKREDNAKVALQEGESTRYIQQMLVAKSFSSNANVNDPASLRGCFYDYLDFCAHNDLRLTLRQVCSAMGINMNQLKAWKTGRSRSKDPRYRELAEEITEMMADYRELLMLNGKVNPVVGIWWQKAYDGMTEEPPREAESITALGEQRSAAEIAEKYANLPE